MRLFRLLNPRQLAPPILILALVQDFEIALPSFVSSSSFIKMLRPVVSAICARAGRDRQQSIVVNRALVECAAACPKTSTPSPTIAAKLAVQISKTISTARRFAPVVKHVKFARDI